jgi:hypothetical protein
VKLAAKTTYSTTAAMVDEATAAIIVAKQSKNSRHCSFNRSDVEREQVHRFLLRQFVPCTVLWNGSMVANSLLLFVLSVLVMEFASVLITC